MERSQLLGHCICDVRRPCPCDVFRDDGICPCAGERPDPVDVSQVKLMALVRNAGCASKIAPAELDAVLGRLPAVNDPAVDFRTGGRRRRGDLPDFRRSLPGANGGRVYALRG